MSEPARKFEQEPEAAEKAPESGERPVEGEKEPLKSIDAWKTQAIGDIHGATVSGIGYARQANQPDIVLGLQQEEQDALKKIRELTEESEKAAKKFMGVQDTELPYAEHVPTWDSGFQSEKMKTIAVSESEEDQRSKFQSEKTVIDKPQTVVIVPESPDRSEHVAIPKDDTEHRAMNEQLKEKQAELAELIKKPKDQETEKDRARRSMLLHEVPILKYNLERHDLEFASLHMEQDLQHLDHDLLEYLRRTPAWNENGRGFKLNTLPDADRVEAMIGLLPLEDKVKAQQVHHESIRLNDAIQTNRVRIAEIIAATVGLDRLLSQSRGQVRSIEVKEAEAAEATETESALKEAEEKRRQAEQAMKEKPSSASRIGKGAAVGTGLLVGGAFAGVWGIFGGFRKALGWFDSGLQKIFGPSWVDKFLVPPKEDKSKKEKE